MSGTVIVGAGTPTQYFLECLPEFRTKYRVYYGVKSGVEISQPEEEAGHIIIDTIFTQRVDERYHKERKPTYDENSCHYRQGFCSLFVHAWLHVKYVSSPF